MVTEADSQSPCESLWSQKRTASRLVKVCGHRNGKSVVTEADSQSPCESLWSQKRTASRLVKICGRLDICGRRTAGSLVKICGHSVIEGPEKTGRGLNHSDSAVVPRFAAELEDVQPPQAPGTGLRHPSSNHCRS